jgi:mannose-6-phosphate isomerase-like protein (cupin superfamily)
MLRQHVVSLLPINYPESFGRNLRGIRYAEGAAGVAFGPAATNINLGDARSLAPKWRKQMVVLKKINLTKAFAAFDETWSPHIGGDINDFQVKLTKLDGAFHWHHHEEEDELFLVVKGTLRMKLREENGGDVVLGPGEYIIVPHGVEHCPVAEPTCEVLLFERNTTLNTGNVENERTIREPKRL